MKKLFLIFFVIFSFIAVLINDCFSALNSKKSATSPKLKAFASYEKLPLFFIENRGQLNDKVCYYLKGRKAGIYFTKEAIVYDLLSPLKEKNSSQLVNNKQEAFNRFSFIIKPVGANRDVRLYAKEERSGRVNYLRGNNPERWLTNIPLYKTIIYKGLYKGIDLTIYGSNSQMEYDLIVSPGADPRTISLACNGIDSLELDDRGNLIIKTPLGDIKHLKPRIYQEIDGRHYDIDGSFVVSHNTFSFDIKDYNKDYALIIDPLTLSYSTYLGGDDNEGAYKIAVDSSGNAYVTGYTWSTDFPSWSGYQWENWGKRDIFVTKFRQSDNTLLYSTFLGGSESETGRGIAVDAQGNAYVTGYTDSSDFPVINAYQAVYGGGDADAFVSKLGPDGFTLIYSTFLGGSESDWAYGIAVDSLGNAYVTGETYSTAFPTKNAYQVSGGGTFQDTFVTKLAPAGSSISYSTFLGGGNSDWGNAIALDASGNAYVTGGTKSSDFPTHNAYQSTYGGGDIDAFISKLGPNGTTLTYSTFLGGSKSDRARDISVDSSGNTYVTGYTDSTDFPKVNAYQATYGGGDTDAFISKLGPGGTTLTYSTFLGGSSDDWGYGIAIDTSGNASIIGATKSANFPMHNAYQAAHGGGDTDAFISKLGPDGTTLTYSTFLGGSSDDWGNSIAVDASTNLYMAGYTASSDFPVLGAYQELFGGGGRDCFFVKFEAEAQNEPPTANAGNDQSLTEGVVVTLDGSNSTDPDDGIDTFQWSQVSGSTVTLSDPSAVKPTFTASTVLQTCEACIFRLTVTDHDGLQDTDDVAITVCPTPAPTYLRGDVAPFSQPDGMVNVGDALIALRFALGLETPSQDDIKSGDVAPLDSSDSPNPDGALTIGDALVILRIALGLVNCPEAQNTVLGPSGQIDPVTGMPRRPNIRLDHPAGAWADVPEASALYSDKVDLRQITLPDDSSLWDWDGIGWQFVSYGGLVIADDVTLGLPGTGAGDETVLALTYMGAWIEIPSTAVTLAKGRPGRQIHVRDIPTPWTLVVAQPTGEESLVEPPLSLELERLYWTDREEWKSRMLDAVSDLGLSQDASQSKGVKVPRESLRTPEDLKKDLDKALVILRAVCHEGALGFYTPDSVLPLIGHSPFWLYTKGLDMLHAVRQEWMQKIETWAKNWPHNLQFQNRPLESLIPSVLAEFAPWGIDLTRFLIHTGTIGAFDLRVFYPYGELLYADAPLTNCHKNEAMKKINIAELAKEGVTANCFLRLYSRRAMQDTWVDWLKDWRLQRIVRWTPAVLVTAGFVSGAAGPALLFASADEIISYIQGHYSEDKISAYLNLETASMSGTTGYFVADAGASLLGVKGATTGIGGGSLGLAQTLYSVALLYGVSQTNWYMLQEVRSITSETTTYDGLQIPPILAVAVLKDRLTEDFPLNNGYPGERISPQTWTLDFSHGANLQYYFKSHFVCENFAVGASPAILCPELYYSDYSQHTISDLPFKAYKKEQWPKVYDYTGPAAQVLRCSVPKTILGQIAAENALGPSPSATDYELHGFAVAPDNLSEAKFHVLEFLDPRPGESSDNAYFQFVIGGIWEGKKAYMQAIPVMYDGFWCEMSGHCRYPLRTNLVIELYAQSDKEPRATGKIDFLAKGIEDIELYPGEHGKPHLHFAKVHLAPEDNIFGRYEITKWELQSIHPDWINNYNENGFCYGPRCETPGCCHLSVEYWEHEGYSKASIYVRKEDNTFTYCGDVAESRSAGENWENCLPPLEYDNFFKIENNIENKVLTGRAAISSGCNDGEPVTISLWRTIRAEFDKGEVKATFTSEERLDDGTIRTNLKVYFEGQLIQSYK